MLIPFHQLHAHPANANVMPAALLAKLEAHIRDTGQCPRLIVRQLPSEDASPRYQILDGHHRAIVLQRLGRTSAECDVWPDIDDARAALLLLTLNRLHGEDDPHKRGSLLATLACDIDPQRLAILLPDDADRIDRLIALAQPPEIINTPHDTADLPHATTFFLSADQHRRLRLRLAAIDDDRNRALAIALQLDRDEASQPRATATTTDVDTRTNTGTS